MRRLPTHKPIPDDWHERVVELWTEDDASRSAGDITRLRAEPNQDADWDDRTKMGAWKAMETPTRASSMAAGSSPRAMTASPSASSWS